MKRRRRSRALPSLCDHDLSEPRSVPFRSAGSDAHPADDLVEEPVADDQRAEASDAGAAMDDTTTDDDVVWWPWALVHQWTSALHVATSTARSTLVTPSS